MAKQTTKKQTANKTTRKTNSKKKEDEKKRSIIPLLLLIILLLLGVIAYTYRDKLQVMCRSGITYLNNQDRTEKKQNKSDKKHSDNDNPLQKAINKLENKTTTTTTTTIRKAASTTTVRQKSTTTTTVKKFVPVTTTTTTVRTKPTTTTTTTTTTTIRKAEPTTTTTAVHTANAAKPVVKTRTSKVYFTRVTMDDSYIVAANREVHYIDSPLTETINVLLQGTNIAEDKKYIVTNIPDNTRLLSARIANNIAYLDFSGEFEENFYGRDSTMYQLQQIVYTATEFDGVDAVQILINGKKQDYLGGEGILIGEPLRRQDFSSR